MTGEEVLSVDQSADMEIENAPICQMLRTKNSFGSFDGHYFSWESGDSTTAVYWCLRTMETAGPDDGYAHPHKCRAGRSCYEQEEE